MTQLPIAPRTAASLLTAATLICACETAPTAMSSAADPAAVAAELHSSTGVGVYFPPITSSDSPQIRFSAMPGVGSEQRQFFADQINVAASSAERAVPVVVQAVGDDRKTLVFMPLGGQATATPYIARGILARMTSVSRFLPGISEMGLSQEFDIYNMGAVLGFERIVVTDGRDFSHEAILIAG